MDDETPRPALWYQPDDDDHTKPVPGLYGQAENGQPEVKLHGSWSDRPALFPTEDERTAHVLHGDVFGQAVTLVDSTITSHRANMSRLRDATLTPQVALEGLWLEASELAFTEVRTEFWDQDVWTEWDAYTADIPRGSRDIKVEYAPPVSQRATASGASISLIDDSTFTEREHPRGWLLESSCAFSIVFPEPVAMDAVFNRFLVPLEVFIVSATGRLSGIKRLNATNSNWATPSQRSSSDRWVTVRKPYAERSQRKLYRPHLLHALDDFEFSRQIPLVFDAVSQHRYSIEHFATIRSRKSGGPLAMFIAACQLVESFDRTLHRDQPMPDQEETASYIDEVLSRFDVDRKYRKLIRSSLRRAHEPSLERRLRRLDVETGNSVSDIIGNKRWCGNVATLRNIVAHGLDRSSEFAHDLRSIRVATDVLLLLFESRWLREIGFSQERAKELLERRAQHAFLCQSIVDNYEHVERMAGRHS